MSKFEWLLNGALPFCMEKAGDEGDAGAAGGDDGDGANSDEGNQPEGEADGQNTGENEGEGNQPEFYRPEGLPEHLLGSDEKETMDKLLSAYTGARKELSKKQGVPEKIDDYKVELPEDIAAKVLKPGDDGKDPVFEAIRGVMHENGIPADKAANVVKTFYEKVAEKLGAAQEEGAEGEGEGSLDFEFKTYGGTEKAQPVIDANKTWIQGLVNQGKITADDAADMETNLAIGQGLAWMDKIRVTLGGGKPIPVNMSGDGSGGGKVTEAELNARVADPRYRPGPKFDKAFHDETTKMFKEVYGDS